MGSKLMNRVRQVTHFGALVFGINTHSLILKFAIIAGLSLVVQPSQAGPITQALVSKGSLGTDANTCEKIESHLGQLFLINADNFSSKQEMNKPLSPAYVKLVKDLNIGGVLPHFRNEDFVTARNSISQFKNATSLPVFIGVDYMGKMIDLRETKSMFTDGRYFGLGYFEGILGTMDNKMSMSCTKLRFSIEGYLHHSFGLNLALGPTVDHRPETGFLGQSSEFVAPLAKSAIQALNDFGIATTIKHFPYTPTDFDLHKTSLDTQVTVDEVQSRIKILVLPTFLCLDRV